MPPRFVSPGGLAQNAIERFLLQRQQDEFEAQRIAIAKAEQESRDKDRAAEIEFRRQQEERLAKEREAMQTSLDDEREFRRASTSADTALPGVIDPGTAALWRKHGFGGLVKEGQPTQGADLGVDDQGVNQYAVIPGVLQTEGGFRWQQARAQEQARAEAAQAAQAAAAERAREAQIAAADRAAADRASRESIAAEGNATRAAIAQASAAADTRAANEKTSAAAAAKAESDKAKAEARATIARLATDLANDPNLTDITGAIEGRGWVFPTTGNREAVRKYDELVNKIALERRGDLKGQGTISNYEAQQLVKAIGLDRTVGPGNLRKKILEIAQQYGTGTTQTGGTVAMVTPDGRDMPAVPLEKVAEMERLGAKRK